MSDAMHIGVCPNCDLEGEAGSPCHERPCSQRSYYFIPREYLDGTRATGRDARIGRLIGRGGWLLVRVLGAGGFGTVFLALQSAMPSKKAAVKLLNRQDDIDQLDVLVRKFKTEAEALAVISHPNVVQLLEYGTHDESPYMVMEYVEGARTLRDEIKGRRGRGERFSNDEVRTLIEQTVYGLDAAHSKAIIHRDIKPENVMLQSVAGTPLLVRIVDFGIAKFLDTGVRSSKVMGTPEYMAPEQFLQDGLGPWTDLYAVGIVACELLTGRLLFSGLNNNQILAAKLGSSSDPIEQVQDLNLSEPVANFFRRALAKDPADRYRNAGQFKAALFEACRGFGASEAEPASGQKKGDRSVLEELPTIPGNAPPGGGQANAGVRKPKAPPRPIADPGANSAAPRQHKPLRTIRSISPADLELAPPRTRSALLVVVSLLAAIAAVVALVVGIWWARSSDGSRSLPASPQPAAYVAPVVQVAPSPSNDVVEPSTPDAAGGSRAKVDVPATKANTDIRSDRGLDADREVVAKPTVRPGGITTPAKRPEPVFQRGGESSTRQVSPVEEPARPSLPVENPPRPEADEEILDHAKPGGGLRPLENEPLK